MYIFADNPAEAATLSATQASLTLDVSQSSRFLYWTGDERAHSRVHFCSEMTISGFAGDASFHECEKPNAHQPSLLVGGSRPAVALTVDVGAVRFSAEALITTQAYIRAASEPSAKKSLAKMTSTSESFSVDDGCWLHHPADPAQTFRLLPRAKIVKIGSPVEIANDDDQEGPVIDAVVARLLEQSKRDRPLMKLLRAQADDMRKRGNHGWMSEKTMMEAILRTLATQHYRQKARSRS
jgi:hypothetical protein